MNEKKNIGGAYLWLSVIVLVLGSVYLGWAWAGEVAVFLVWSITTMVALVLFLPGKILYKNMVGKHYLTNVACVLCVIILISVGWINTACFLLGVACAARVKRELYLEGLKYESHNN